MKAAILTELNKPLVIAEIEEPKALDVGQVRVKVHYSGICGSQLGEISGVKGEDSYLPHLLGHEGSGTVLAIGPGVRHIHPGDKVVLHWRRGSGIEANPPLYQWKGLQINAGWVTTFNETAIVSENRCTKIPDDSEMDIAALFGCAVTTGFGVAENNAKIKPGESVMIYGAGGIGLSIIQAAKMMGAYPIYAVDMYAEKLKLAEQLGADYTFLGDSPNQLPVLDVFIDNTGNPEVIEFGYRVTKSQGRVILVGVPKANANINIHSLPLHFGKILTGSHGGESIPTLDIPRLQRLYRAGRLKLRDLITEEYSLNDINLAINDMRDGLVKGRCLIKMS